MSMETIAQKRNRQAFTLVECLVVLAIIAIVLWVGVPALGKIYEQQLLEQQTRLLEEELIWLRSEAKRTSIPASFKVIDQHTYRLTIGVGETSESTTHTLIHKRLSLTCNATEGTVLFSPAKTAFTKCTITVRGKYAMRKVVVSDFGRVKVSD